ncbi:sushi, von Willebrand factor type A, EGF and pentraxin domain-containing protein 1 [Exaiptasia diaphana]|uniref:HYR domain-containing protein n=1 Tax=Exaiptasia diaphana TaxID=2652724 RepID=A0A913XGT4_EXADI|nr:sushi, von Willebrand factor type A, EGF and pentraxin domain-containing protein 1 [Exaiptasia diaphana]KXJ20373.1 Sushi, von Willebrand factor type A, EGF and pentraxin domain-containing protein 1 [Exaiptasia diaphana]
MMLIVVLICFITFVNQSTLGQASVPDYEQPKVQCPDDILINSKGRSEIVSWKVIATDNSGVTPTISCSPKNGTSMRVPSHDIVGCEAKDAAGNYAHCFFSIDVKDVAPPKITCPPDVNIVSDKSQLRVNYGRLEVPEDNDGLPPSVYCSRQSGAMTSNPGQYTITCTAQDQSLNTASCSIKVTLTSPKCKMFPPPINGALACNDLSASLKVCTVSCNEKYDFEYKPAHAYTCPYGHWVNLFGGRTRWPNCTVKSNSKKLMKDSMFYYKGNPKDPAVTQQIQQNWVGILHNVNLVPPYLCIGKPECKASNVKVIAG